MRKLLGPNPRRVQLVLAVALLAAAPAPAQQRDERPAYRRSCNAARAARRGPARAHDAGREDRADHHVWTQKKRAVRQRADDFDPAAARRLYPAGIGHFARPSDLQEAGSPFKTPYRDERQTIELVNAIQRYASRHAPRHSGAVPRRRPARLRGARRHALSASHRAGELLGSGSCSSGCSPSSAREIRARGVQLVLAPVVDVGRDPRWGRIEETYGEDPYLVSELGVAAVHGFQGESLPLAHRVACSRR